MRFERRASAGPPLKHGQPARVVLYLQHLEVQRVDSSVDGKQAAPDAHAAPRESESGPETKRKRRSIIHAADG